MAEKTEKEKKVEKERNDKIINDIMKEPHYTDGSDYKNKNPKGPF